MSGKKMSEVPVAERLALADALDKTSSLIVQMSNILRAPGDAALEEFGALVDKANDIKFPESKHFEDL